MSALGQKQTCAMQNVMSALPPIATAKADIRQLGITKASRSNHQAMSALHLKADMCGAIPDVRYGPKADIDLMAGSQETWKFHLLRL